MLIKIKVLYTHTHTHTHTHRRYPELKCPKFGSVEEIDKLRKVRNIIFTLFWRKSQKKTKRSFYFLLSVTLSLQKPYTKVSIFNVKICTRYCNRSNSLDGF